MWDVAVTFMFMMFGAFVFVSMGAMLIWVLYVLQNGDRDD